MDICIRGDNFAYLFTKHFLQNIPIKQLKKKRCYPPRGFLWCACEYNMVSNLQGQDAMEAYDRIDKTGANEITFDNSFKNNEIAMPLSLEHNSSYKIMCAGLMEHYVIGKNFSWCYIVTHEPGACGPYFIQSEHRAGDNFSACPNS